MVTRTLLRQLLAAEGMRPQDFAAALNAPLTTVENWLNSTRGEEIVLRKWRSAVLGFVRERQPQLLSSACVEPNGEHIYIGGLPPCARKALRMAAIFLEGEEPQKAAEICDAIVCSLRSRNDGATDDGRAV
jgi:hypothetical protein